MALLESNLDLKLQVLKVLQDFSSKSGKISILYLFVEKCHIHIIKNDYMLLSRYETIGYFIGVFFLNTR